MNDASAELTHVIEFVSNVRSSIFPDVKITEKATGEVTLLVNPGNLDPDTVNPVWLEQDTDRLWFKFCDLLMDIAGGERRLAYMLDGRRRPIPRADKERLCAAYAVALDGAVIRDAAKTHHGYYRLGFVKSEITGGRDIRIMKVSNGKGAVLHDLPEGEDRLGFRQAVARILGPGHEKSPAEDITVTRDAVRQIRNAYDEWTSRFLRQPHDPKLATYLKPQGFSPRNPNL